MKIMWAGLLSMVAFVAETNANEGETAFARLQHLVGEWEAPLPGNQIMRNVFRPVAFGTALAHEEWKNGEQLTATVFYVVGSELRADHYCDMGNQLRYVGVPSADMSTIHFKLRDAVNLDSHPRHFRSTTWRLVSADRHIQDWEIVAPGKEPKVAQMDFKRTAADDLSDPEALVRADVRALNQANAAARLALFSPDAKVFEPSRDPDRLAGDLSPTLGTHEQRDKALSKMFTDKPRAHVELFDIASAGDLAVAKVRYSEHHDPSRSMYELNLYRVRDGRIQDLWHLARSEVSAAEASRQAEDVIRRLVEANNRGDVEALLALFSPLAKNFRNSGQPHALGDKPSVTVVDQKTRRDTYLKTFANGAPAQVTGLRTVSLGGMIVARGIATLPTGEVVDELSIYRIENGSILRDWFVHDQARPDQARSASVIKY
jgi:hypothetical protein